MSTGNYELGAFDRSIEQTIANKIIERHIYEAHGSIHHLQYLRGCKESIWSADDFKPVIDTERLVLTSDFPYCPPVLISRAQTFSCLATGNGNSSVRNCRPKICMNGISRVSARK